MDVKVAGSGVTVPNISPVVIPDLPPVIPDPSFPDAIDCHVPRLKGKTLKQAKPVLLAAHCKLGKVTRRRSSRVAKGRVIATRPPAFTVHRLHTKVALTVSTGKKR